MDFTLNADQPALSGATCRAEVVRRSAQLVFMRGLILAKQRVVVSVDGIWKVLEARKPVPVPKLWRAAPAP